MKTEDLEHLVLHYPGGRRTTIEELLVFEPADTSVGISGCYIEVKDRLNQAVILNDDGSNWIHGFNEDEDPDWTTIIGTFSGDLFKNLSTQEPTISPREIIKAFGLNDRYYEGNSECLDLAFGIGFDTELVVS